MGTVCTCPPPRNNEKGWSKEYVNSELVFIGEVSCYNEEDYTYTIEVCEVFKGNVESGDLITGSNDLSCHPWVELEKDWLFYGTMISDETFQANGCGHTTTYEKPTQRVLTSQLGTLNQNETQLQLDRDQVLKQINYIRNIQRTNEICE
jgi:hypothetical protein